MSSAVFPSRETQTTLPCRKCEGRLKAVRACREVVLRCPRCSAKYEVAGYAAEMDEALEDFLGQVACNRI